MDCGTGDSRARRVRPGIAHGPHPGDYARRVAELAPQAWLINFTNPVGIMAEAFIREGVSDRCIGVCDTPREQFVHIAKALGIPFGKASFDYLGLNHWAGSGPSSSTGATSCQKC